ncbi:ribosome biogenesis protein BRX1 homolog [Macrosteles quadrilineatus]|uniref:ribosome biogenesis protein BRX1 homolog n=1 Tax=Macrosteles quadrilineatus TaxID=74068 RepID=UPI0023E23B02|nr:ribosome biogenesis protein BRX1 homolog [Macrosteles quadrilineatus]
MGKKKGLKRKLQQKSDDSIEKEKQPPPATRSSDEPIPKKSKWTNRTRVLVFATRGITHRDRHLLQDLRTMLPHSRDENKMERGENFLVVNEMSSMKNCDKCILLEGRNKKDLFMWVSNTPDGPSAKFLVESVFTMGEMKLTGNCLKGSRPLLSFDESFDTSPQYALLKELFTQIFGTPAYHPKSQPFTDRVVAFSVLDNRIWFRNYQILTEDGALAEIGPRFVLNPIKIFEKSFGGKTLWENPKYVTPKQYRRLLKQTASTKYVDRKQQKEAFLATRPKESYMTKPNDDIFEGNPLEKAKEISEKVKELKVMNQEHFQKKNSESIAKKKTKLTLSNEANKLKNKKMKPTPSTETSKLKNKKTKPTPSTETSKLKIKKTKPTFSSENNKVQVNGRKKKLKKSVSKNSFSVS